MRRTIALGALLTLGISPLVFQRTDEPRYSETAADTGKLSLPLQAFGRSTNLYRLRDAVFLVERRVGANGNSGEISNSVSVTGSGFSAASSSAGGVFGGDGGSLGGTGATGSVGGSAAGNGATGPTGGFAAGGNGAT